MRNAYTVLCFQEKSFEKRTLADTTAPTIEVLYFQETSFEIISALVDAKINIKKSMWPEKNVDIVTTVDK